jgi:cellobiose phosphorylase
LQGAELLENEKERYDKYLSSDVEGSIYEHCKKAIDRACRFGENGLPKIGIGDWNDGFSNIGPEGKGESVWLGFFIYQILEEFAIIASGKGENEVAELYRNNASQLKENLNNNGWDGRWYKRAFADNGDVYGSMENDECKIDSIAQSWSVISGAGEKDKQLQSMESLEKHLVDKENGIIKLLDPPFVKGKLEPGYIKAYLPGVRENGGQYTHSAIWAVIAEAMLGKGDKAVELFRMITPIEHSRTQEAANKYKVEPYVIAADVYGARNLLGTGGWTWYTGSSSWYYLAGIQYILGLNIYHNCMSFNPCIPKEWEEFDIRYKFGESIYNIKVKNPNRKNSGVSSVTINGEVVENNIQLDGSGKIFNIEVEI